MKPSRRVPKSRAKNRSDSQAQASKPLQPGATSPRQQTFGLEGQPGLDSTAPRHTARPGMTSDSNSQADDDRSARKASVYFARPQPEGADDATPQRPTRPSEVAPAQPAAPTASASPTEKSVQSGQPDNLPPASAAPLPGRLVRPNSAETSEPRVASTTSPGSAMSATPKPRPKSEFGAPSKPKGQQPSDRGLSGLPPLSSKSAQDDSARSAGSGAAASPASSTPSKPEVGSERHTARQAPESNPTSGSRDSFALKAPATGKDSKTDGSLVTKTKPKGMDDFRANAQRQAKEQKAVGGILSTFGYLLLAGLLLVVSLAGFGGYTLYKMIQAQSVTVAQLEDRYDYKLEVGEQAVADTNATVSDLTARIEELTTQLATANEAAARQQKQIETLATTLDGLAENQRAGFKQFNMSFTEVNDGIAAASEQAKTSDGELRTQLDQLRTQIANERAARRQAEKNLKYQDYQLRQDINKMKRDVRGRF